MKTFSIIANVAFEIPKFLAGAFNAYHIKKGNLTKAGNMGTVTPAGVTFFAAREGEKQTAKTYAAFVESAKGSKYPIAEKQGIKWPVGNQGIAWQAGQGNIGKSAFYFALCELSSKPAKKAPVTVQKAPTVSAAQKAKPTVAAKATKPAKSVKKPLAVTA